MRWMLRKDLLILARSRVLVGVLVVYPIAVALLIGLAISRAPSRPRVGIVNLAPSSAVVELGNTRLEVGHYYAGLIRQVQPVPLATRAQAVRAVETGRVLAAVVIPANIAARLSSVTHPAQIEVIYNGEALEQSFVHSTIEAAISQANLELAEEIRQVAAHVLVGLVRGGNLGVAAAPQNLPGLSSIPAMLHHAIAHLPRGRNRAQLQQLAGYIEFAAQNIGIGGQVLNTVSRPIQIHATLLHGRRTPLNAYAVVVAVTISLMFVCVLLAAGGIALEREEHTLGRLVRGLFSCELLIAQKLLLAAGSALVVAFAMLAGIGAFVGVEWARVGQWLLALAIAALAFAALGVAIGALAREVRAASLLAFLLSLPLAFLALVPAGAVAGGVYDVVRAVSLVFPYKAALEALDAAVNRSSPGLAISLAHLLALTVLFAVLARLGLRRVE
jgi:hypothetical protein